MNSVHSLWCQTRNHRDWIIKPILCSVNQSCAYQTLLIVVSHSCILEHPTSLLFLDVMIRPVPSSSSMLTTSVIFCQVTQEPLSPTIYTKSKTVRHFGMKADFEILSPCVLVGIESTIFRSEFTFTFFITDVKNSQLFSSQQSMTNFKEWNKILTFCL